MTAGTHLAFAGLCGVIAQGMGYPLALDTSAALAFGALLPDVDTTASGLGKFIKPVSRLLERRFGHRTVTHSLLGMLIVALIAYPLALVNVNTWLFLLLGFASHVILDTVNVIGVPLLYPSRLQFWFIANRRLRMPYGSPLEWQFAVGFALVAMVLFPTSDTGFSFAFNRWLGTPSGLVADYLELRDTNEVFAYVDGFNTETQEKIDGRYKIVDILSKESLILEDENGAALALGFIRGAQLTTYRTYSMKGDPIRAKEYDLDVSGRTIGDVLAALPSSNRVWITANLQTTERTQPTPPRVGRFPRVKAINLQLEARSAHPSDFKGLESVFLERGTARVRIEYAPSETMRDTIDFQSQFKKRTHIVSIPNLPNLSGVIVKPGDRVLENQPLARYVNDAVLSAVTAQVEKAKLMRASAQSALTSLKATLVSATPTLEERVKSAARELERMKFLVNAGAEPPVKLAQAQDAVNQAEAKRLEQLSTLTSQRAKLEQTIQAADLDIQSATSTRLETLGKQWVRSPFAALVSEVKIKSVNAKGATLEIVLVQDASEK